MKLSTRLIVSFCIIIFVPVLLTSITLWGFIQIQFREIQRTYDVEGEPYEYLMNSTGFLSHVTRKDYDELKQIAQSEPEKLDDAKFLEQANLGLLSKNSYLLVRKDNAISFEGGKALQKLPSYHYADYYEDSGRLSLSGEQQSLIKQIDFIYPDGAKGSIFIVTSMEMMMPEMKSLLGKLLVSVVLILVLTAGMLTIWIYKGIINPIRRLQKAAQNIKEGNLDFTIDDEGTDELGVLCQNFEEMRKRLKGSAEEKLSNEKDSKVLVSNISHDLKTPITAIKGYVEGIIDGVADTPEKMDKYIRTIYNKANEMDMLINELTIYSQIDTDRIPYNFNRINVAEYFEDCIEEVGLDLESKDIGLAYLNYADGGIQVIADPEQIKRVINNIVGNSIKYLDKQNGFINIRLRDVGDFIQIEIEDNGKGIAAKDLPFIFDRFYRTDASRNSATGGSGIGLSIVKKIIEDHGGKIWATSKEATGTVMYFVLRKYQEVLHE